MNNITTLLNVLLDLFSVGYETIGVIQKANEEGRDVTKDEIDDIVAQRNELLLDLKKAVGG